MVREAGSCISIASGEPQIPHLYIMVNALFCFVFKTNVCASSYHCSVMDGFQLTCRYSISQQMHTFELSSVSPGLMLSLHILWSLPANNLQNYSTEIPWYRASPIIGQNQVASSGRTWLGEQLDCWEINLAMQYSSATHIMELAYCTHSNGGCCLVTGVEAKTQLSI